MYGFAIFYAVCLVLNWWFYLRKVPRFATPNYRIYCYRIYWRQT